MIEPLVMPSGYQCVITDEKLSKEEFYSRALPVLPVLPEDLIITSIVDVYGRPRCTREGYDFSYSHSKSFSVLCISTNGCFVGVDIEPCITSERLYYSFLSEQEVRYIDSCKVAERAKEATKIWTRKEAFVKAVGVGMITHPNTLDVLPVITASSGEIMYQGTRYTATIILDRWNAGEYCSGVAISS